MKYRYYLFDFDGTIADTGEGIRKSVAWAAEKLGFAIPDRATLDRFIGPPLVDSFMEYCGMDEAQAERAVAAYRERYLPIGLYEANVYEGIPELLKTLKARGAYVAIASGKPTIMLERLSEHFALTPLLDAISGTDLGRHGADKRDLILAALPEGTDPAEVCMVGDRRFDIEAAKALGMGAIGAGYGYATEGELERAGADEVFPNVQSMTEALIQ